MRLARLSVTGFRNLEPVSVSVPPEGVALVGPNGHGKTNAMEAAYYPVLFRSFRGATDTEITEFSGDGFRVECHYSENGGSHDVAVRYTRSPKQKSITVDDAEVDRLAEGVGHWLAVAFIPADTALAAGPAQGRRQYLDRMLSLADREYLGALTKYRAALSQRNAALKQRSNAAEAFEPALMQYGAAVVERRLQWVNDHAALAAEEMKALGETAGVACRYTGQEELSSIEAWPAALAAVRPTDEARGTTTIGPHRDDLVLEVGGKSLRTYGSTGQQRGAAVALKLLEWDTLAQARNVHPALLLDDVFAELDDARQARLAERLRQVPECQILVSAPRRDELPDGLDLPVWHVERGAIRGEGAESE